MARETFSTGASGPGALSPGQRWRGVTAAIASITAVGIALSLGLPLLALVLESRGISPLWIGINTAFAGISAVAVTPFVTPLARRLGTARLTFWVLVAAAVSFFLFYVADAFWLWFPLRLVFHGAVTAAFVLSEFWINALAPDARRGFVMGLYATVLSLGFVAGPAMFAAVGSVGPLPFAVGTAVLVAAALPVLLARGAAPAIDSEPGERFIRFLVIAPMATLAALVFGAIESGSMSLLPLYGLRIGLDTADAVLLLSAMVGGNVMLQIPLGLLADRFDKRWLLFLCAVIGVAGAMLLPSIGHDFALLLGVLFVWGGFIAGLYTIGLTHLGSRFSGADLASANAAFVMMYAFGMLTGPASLGAALDTGNPHALPYVIAGFFALYAVFAAFRIARAEAR